MDTNTMLSMVMVVWLLIFMWYTSNSWLLSFAFMVFVFAEVWILNKGG